MVTGAVSHLHLRYRARHAEGHWVTVDSRAQAVLDGEGHFAGAVVVSRDISDKLESEQLLQTSRESAEKASKAKSDFLSRMSHELRTPLNSILGFAQLIQMDDIPGQQADAVDHILRAGRHLLDLIDEVLDIARIESGYLELTLAPVVVAEIVSEALELTNPMAARAEVVMRSLVDQRDGQVVVADRQRLMQVLLNLLSNAVKYNKPGGRVDVTCEQGPSGRLQVAVADTGRVSGPRTSTASSSPSTASGSSRPASRAPVWASRCHSTSVSAWAAASVWTRLDGVGSTFVVDLPESVPAAVTVTGVSGGDAPEGAGGGGGAGDEASSFETASEETVTSDVVREAARATAGAKVDQGEIGTGARAPESLALDTVGTLDEASTSDHGT